jgi:hypothetical protein
VLVAEVQFYDVIVWLHITGVIVGFGPTFAFGIYLSFVGRNDPRSLPVVLEATAQVMRTLTTIGALLVLVSGLYLAEDRWDFGYFFITWGLIAILVLLALVWGAFLPNNRRERELAERDLEASGSGRVEFGPDFWSVVRRDNILGALAGILVIVTIYVMATKPFL